MMRLDIFNKIINQLPRLPLVDLGAGHCKFSKIAHDIGFPVTSIDARSDRVPGWVTWPFLQQDVRDADLSLYDIVCILGLFYHLTLDDQIALLRKCQGKIVIIDTHCTDNCSDRATVEGFDKKVFEGSHFQEVPSLTSSWGNSTSFWHTEDSLRLFFQTMGFTAEKVLPEHAELRAFWVLR